MEIREKKSKKLVILACIIVLGMIQTIPVFMVKPMGSKVLTDKNINLYYQAGDEQGAKEVFELLNVRAEDIRKEMKFVGSEPTDVYVYKSQKQLAIREAGIITLVIAPSWHIGDSHNGNVMIVSPYTKVQGHTHESILNATLHEYVHSIVFKTNPKLSYFWDNGLATYLSGQEPREIDLMSRPFPTLEQTHTENGLKFGNMGGYAFSYNYIEYLEATFGWDKVISYGKGEGSYEDIFGESEEAIYRKWNTYFQEKYPISII